MGLPAQLLPTGSVFAERYEVVRCIASGGMGAIYEVVHTATKRRCALKVMLLDLSSDPDLQARFAQEATVTAEIQSDHLVSIVDAGIDGDTATPFMVMELLEGGDLGRIIGERGPMDPNLAVTLLAQAALALDKTHAAGIVHRDLKPENLFLSWRDDGTPHIRILDFGIAKIIASSRSRTQDTRSIGTPAYMPPEQILGDGNIGPSADLYSLAHIAFELLVGVPYWKPELAQHGTGYAFMTAIINGVVEPASKRAHDSGIRLPPDFDPWFEKATAVDPQLRFERPTRMVASLARALNAEVGGMKIIDVGSEVSLELTLPASDQRVTIPKAQASGPTLASSDHGIKRPISPSAAAVTHQASPREGGGTTAGFSATPRSHQKRRWRVSWLLAATVVGVAVGGGALWLSTSRPSQANPNATTVAGPEQTAAATAGPTAATASPSSTVAASTRPTQSGSTAAPQSTTPRRTTSSPRPSSTGQTTSRTPAPSTPSSTKTVEPKDPTSIR